MQRHFAVKDVPRKLHVPLFVNVVNNAPQSHI